MDNRAAELWPVRVLFLCWHNDLRSQLAEATLRHRGAGQFLACSAGIVPSRLHPLAAATLARAGIGSAGQKAKDVGTFVGGCFDVVVTLGERTHAVPCLPPAVTSLHWPIADPLAAGDPAAQRAACERVCAELGERVRLLIGAERGKKRRALTVRWLMGTMPVDGLLPMENAAAEGSSW